MILYDAPCLTQSMATAVIGFFVAVIIMTWKSKPKKEEDDDDLHSE